MTSEVAIAYGQWILGLLFTYGPGLAAFGVSLWSIKAANAARRQADHAKTQAEAAVVQASAALRQADHAKTQAEAAQQQVALMQSAQLLDAIGVGYRIRRQTIGTIKALKSYNTAALRGHDVTDVTQKLDEFSKQIAMLEDMPPVFPPNVRALLFGAMQMIAETPGPYRDAQLDLIERQFNHAVTAMDVVLAKKINQLSE